jgi:hypothetical protein
MIVIMIAITPSLNAYSLPLDIDVMIPSRALF